MYSQLDKRLWLSDDWPFHSCVVWRLPAEPDLPLQELSKINRILDSVRHQQSKFAFTKVRNLHFSIKITTFPQQNTMKLCFWSTMYSLSHISLNMMYACILFLFSQCRMNYKRLEIFICPNRLQCFFPEHERLLSFSFLSFVSLSSSRFFGLSLYQDGVIQEQRSNWWPQTERLISSQHKRRSVDEISKL